jgi:ParB family chromosome partitioning protein
MAINASNSQLREIPVGLIDRNPDNPRILFRQGELESLLESIRLYGIQVPITLYKEGARFVLIDGERRWICSNKLNRRTIPALVQEKPGPLTNLLLMFNIHSLREQWDLLTIAMKLPKIIRLLEQQTGQQPKERDIAAKTGLVPGLIRRAKLLMELPEEYKQEILLELHKPKAQQKITEDLFIEMERSLKTVERSMPALIQDKDVVRRVLIDKYKAKTIGNIVHFRQIGKIARATNVHADAAAAKQALKKLFQPNTYSIEQAYGSSVSEAYTERDIASRATALLERLGDLDVDDLDEDVLAALRRLHKRLSDLLDE